MVTPKKILIQDLELADEEIKRLREENRKLKSERDNCLKEVKLCYNNIHSLEGQISDLEKLKDFKVYTFEGDVYVKAEDYKKKAIENISLKEENDRLKNNAMEDMKEITKLEQENKKLREFKEKREESMFYFKSQMERAEPKTAREAEDLQKAKELFEKLYREELYYLEKENKQLKENIEMLSGNIILG